MLARGQQGCKPFDDLSAFRPCNFMNTLSILMGISELSMRVAPIILFLISPPPHFLFFLGARALKGANTVLVENTISPIKLIGNRKIFFEMCSPRDQKILLHTIVV